MRRTVGALLPVVLLSVLLPGTGRAAAPVPCRDLDFGPARSARPVLVCYGVRDGAVVINVSQDRGRTWTEKRAVGTPEPTDYFFSVLVSPGYDTDRTIYLRYQSLGLYASTDGGATFGPADAQGGGEVNDRLTALDAYGPALPGLDPQPAVAIPRRGSAVLYRGVHLAVAGGGRQQDRGFFQLGHGPGSAVFNVSQGPDETFAMRVHAAPCSPELTCPGGTRLTAGTIFDEAAVDPAPKATTAVLLVESEQLRPALWATTDRGTTFSRVTGFDRAMAAYARGVPSVQPESVAVLPGGKEWVVKFRSNRGYFLLATTDAGRTWRPRLAPGDASRIVATPDGRLLSSGFVFRCSRDRGRSWQPTCR
jgi:hypothetical protein